MLLIMDLLQFTLAWHAAFQLCTHIISPFCLCHYTIIYTTKLTDDQKTYWNASLVSSLHAIVVSCLAMFAVIEGQLWINWPHLDMEATTPWSHLTIKIMTSYLLSDAGLTLFYRKGKSWKGWKVNLIHHFVVGLINYNIIIGSFGHAYGLIGTLLEMTTPLVNARWFLYTSGETNTFLYLFNGVALVVLWFIVRIVVAGPFSMYPLWLDSDDMSVGRRVTFLMTYGGVYPLQCWWFYKLVRGALKVLNKKKVIKETVKETVKEK